MGGPRLLRVMQSSRFEHVVAMIAVPARDEAERIADCLLAIDAQALPGGQPVGVVLLVNNTTDSTPAVAAELAPHLRLRLHVQSCILPAGQAHAGMARRLAMAVAERLAPPGVPLLTTDADGRVSPGWLEQNLFHLARGADAVFGRALIDPVEAARIPPALHEADARECAYARLLDEIASLVDPDEADPWPRHTEHSGASIAVTRRAFRAVGGIPAVPLAEDRAFHAALLRAGARIRHAPEVEVVVSGRILGRAAGGMADTIRRRLVAPDPVLDEALEPASARLGRLRLRAALRLACSEGGDAALRAEFRRQGLDPSLLPRAAPPEFARARALLEARLPARRVAVADLARETAAATAIRDALRAAGEGGGPAGVQHPPGLQQKGPSTRASSLPSVSTL